LLSIVLGPWAAVIAVSIALAVQALLFGDGGITSYGANCFNMAVVGAIVGGAVYRMLRATGGKKKRTVLAAGLAGYASLNASALCAALELGVQPLLHHAADGRPLYSPFPLSVTIPAIVGAHLAVYGLVEAAFTMLAVAYIQKAYPELLKEKGNPQ
nr:energy-coupling factor ABC transporter permease [Nitrospiraceae bacterium]